MQYFRNGSSPPRALQMVRMLVDERPEALQAKDNTGETPIIYLFSSYYYRNLYDRGLCECTVDLLCHMIQRGGPKSLWCGGSPRHGEFITTALYLANNMTPMTVVTTRLLRALIDTWPYALCFGFEEGINTSYLGEGEEQDKLENESFTMSAALTEALLHGMTAAVVPDAIREHVKEKLLSEGYTPDFGSRAHFQARWCEGDGSSPPSGMHDTFLQEFLASDLLYNGGAFEKFVTGLYRMNKAGRFQGDLDDMPLEQHARILAGAGGNMSCVYLHLSECLEATGRLPFPTDFLRLIIAAHPGLLEKRGGSRRTLLHLASARRCPPEQIQLLIELNRAALTMKDGDGNLPIHLACGAGDVPTARLLIEEDPSTLKVSNMEEMFPLHYACRSFLHSEPELLVTMEMMIKQHRHPVQARDSTGRYPLHYACHRWVTSEKQALALVRYLIKKNSIALQTPDRENMTPIMTALNNANLVGTLPTPEQLGLLKQMIKRGGPSSLRVQGTDSDSGRPTVTSALYYACRKCPVVFLVSSLISACPAAAEDKDDDGKLPLHHACSHIFSPLVRPQVLESIRTLIDAYPDALQAIDSENRTPIMTACADGTQPTPEGLELLEQMITRGGPSALRVQGTRQDGSMFCTTALSVALDKCPDPRLIRQLIETYPIALCVSDAVRWTVGPAQAELVLEHEEGVERVARDDETVRQENAGRDEVNEMLRTESFFMLLAVVEALLRDTTREAVPEETLGLVRGAVASYVHPKVLNSDGRAAALAVQSLVQAGKDPQSLIATVLGDADVREFLQSSDSFQGFLTGLYRMNRAGRLEDGIPAEQHMEILATGGSDLSCLFLHLRDSPSLPFICADPPAHLSAECTLCLCMPPVSVLDFDSSLTCKLQLNPLTVTCNLYLCCMIVVSLKLVLTMF
jgi:ankyrin repeat protein